MLISLILSADQHPLFVDTNPIFLGLYSPRLNVDIKPVFPGLYFFPLQPVDKGS
jgi:hypothetical protein